MSRRVPTRSLGVENGWASLLILQMLSCVFLTMSHAHADEVIEVDVQGKERRRQGEILDFRGDRLTMQVGQREITIPAARIKEIDAEWISSHVTGDTDFADRDFESALNSYRTALKREQRTWVKRRILARIVRCQSMTGRDVSACQNFARLLSEDKDTPYFDSIPLAWHVAQPSHQLQALVKDWLGSQNEPAKRLIAASWLLTSPDRSAAITVLRQIARVTGQETAGQERRDIGAKFGFIKHIYIEIIYPGNPACLVSFAADPQLLRKLLQVDLRFKFQHRVGGVVHIL